MSTEAASAWSLVVDGMVSSPVRLNVEALRRMEQRVVVPNVHCIEGFDPAVAHWSGVPIEAIVAAAQPDQKARYVEVRSGDYVSAFRLDSLARRGLVLALDFNGAAIPQGRGGPVRLIFERGACFDLVKWVDTVRFAADGSAATTAHTAAERKAAERQAKAATPQA